MAKIHLKGASEWMLPHSSNPKRSIKLNKDKTSETFDPRYVNRTKIVEAIIDGDIEVEDWDWKAEAKRALAKDDQTSKATITSGTSQQTELPDNLMVTLGNDRSFWKSNVNPDAPILRIFEKKNVLKVNRHEDPQLYAEVVNAIKHRQLRIIQNEEDGIMENAIIASTQVPPGVMGRVQQLLRKKNVDEIVQEIKSITVKDQVLLPALREHEMNADKPRPDVLKAIEYRMAESGMEVMTVISKAVESYKARKNIE